MKVSDISNKIVSSTGQGISIGRWGPAFWSVLSQCVMSSGTTKGEITDFHNLLGILPSIIPCPACSSHAKQYISEHDCSNSCKTQDQLALMKWMNDFHNQVNNKTGKKTFFNLAQAVQKFQTEVESNDHVFYFCEFCFILTALHSHHNNENIVNFTSLASKLIKTPLSFTMQCISAVFEKNKGDVNKLLDDVLEIFKTHFELEFNRDQFIDNYLVPPLYHHFGLKGDSTEYKEAIKRFESKIATKAQDIMKNIEKSDDAQESGGRLRFYLLASGIVIIFAIIVFIVFRRRKSTRWTVKDEIQDLSSQSVPSLPARFFDQRATPPLR